MSRDVEFDVVKQNGCCVFFKVWNRTIISTFPQFQKFCFLELALFFHSRMLILLIISVHFCSEQINKTKVVSIEKISEFQRLRQKLPIA